MATNTNNRTSPRKFRAFFGLTEPPLLRMNPYSILIVPSEEQLKEPRYQIQVDIHVKFGGDVDSMSMSGYFGVANTKPSEPIDTKWLELFVNNSDNEFVAAEEWPAFFTMLPSMEDYRRIVSVLGPDEASMVLLALNDIVALAELEPRSELPSIAANTPVFQRAFVRTAEALICVRNPGPIRERVLRQT